MRTNTQFFNKKFNYNIIHNMKIIFTRIFLLRRLIIQFLKFLAIPFYSSGATIWLNRVHTKHQIPCLSFPVKPSISSNNLQGYPLERSTPLHAFSQLYFQLEKGQWGSQHSLLLVHEDPSLPKFCTFEGITISSQLTVM